MPMAVAVISPPDNSSSPFPSGATLAPGLIHTRRPLRLRLPTRRPTLSCTRCSEHSAALAPRSPDLRPDAQPWPPEQDTVTALRDLVVGRSVELATSGRAKDRYGRLLAHLFLDDNGDRVWVQGRLLSTGHARAYGLPDS